MLIFHVLEQLAFSMNQSGYPKTWNFKMVLSKGSQFSTGRLTFHI